MSVRRQINESHGIYFITFTCIQWLNLIELSQSFDAVYNWFDILKKKGHFIIGYVIMPNHVHAIIAFVNTDISINKIIGNGKRFMAYEIVGKLQKQKQTELLNQLSSLVNQTDRKRNKQHEVFEPSFDWKHCLSDDFIRKKLDYIHNNPCRGKWLLAKSPIEYVHSSARFYALGKQGVYDITSYSDLGNVNLAELRGAAESRGGDSAEKARSKNDR